MTPEEKHAMPTLTDLRGTGKRALAGALALIEIARGTQAMAALLDAAVAEPLAHVIGLTGPPGVGKSTLANCLVRGWRAQEETVGVIAVDPSSRASGGALLGDRARLATDPNDRGVFVRSMAARDRLGGLSEDSIAAIALMRALFQRVLVESVGIGQSEADISFAVDTVILCIQPGSGDSLQFMKAGVMELPDIVVVTKADIGAAAQRAASEVSGALTLFQREDGWSAPVILVSATDGAGLADLAKAVADHQNYLGAHRLKARRMAQEAIWIKETLKAKYGSEGCKAVVAHSGAAHSGAAQFRNLSPFQHLGPFQKERILSLRLAAALKRVKDEQASEILA